MAVIKAVHSFKAIIIVDKSASFNAVTNIIAEMCAVEVSDLPVVQEPRFTIKEEKVNTQSKAQPLG